MDHILEIAVEAAHEAGDIMKKMRSTFTKEIKKDGTPVTDADKACSKAIREMILGAFPDHGYLCEESGFVKGTSELWWATDPIDGTSSYINGEKTAVVSIAMLNGSEIELGIIYNPFTDEFYAGAKGMETRLNGTLIHTNHETELSGAVVNFQISDTHLDDIIGLYKLSADDKIGKLVSLKGSTAYAFSQIADGSQSVYIAHSRRPANAWDICAGIYFVRSVGGIVTDWKGKDIVSPFEVDNLVVSANQDVHEQALSAIADILR
ncbi:hypothetical protein COV93_04955 [Candidatus Woesearchaeota archaeon CG11_big_fil_rev_8_21_14_0_20_43_8]|nr:MAG: hypothetical protein COV93_04955 [Candidatus Woesearchaeota archaeon CG11_big_fil_rev_8_21_14_0_20_43_8]PIO05610.1 MAG: hypothetical protein COT47_04070 [Candidatus Woesearchaeota archaeon CG08_land_8_20_14_0_20_43_7]